MSAGNKKNNLTSGIESRRKTGVKERDREGERGANGCWRAGGRAACGAGRRARRRARPPAGASCPPHTCRASRGRPRGQPACPACRPARIRVPTMSLVDYYHKSSRVGGSREWSRSWSALRQKGTLLALALALALAIAAAVLLDTGAPHSTSEPQEIEEHA